jgi:hypothetical protein
VTSFLALELVERPYLKTLKAPIDPQESAYSVTVTTHDNSINHTRQSIFKVNFHHERKHDRR